MKKRKIWSLFLVLLILVYFTETIAAEDDEYEEYTDNSFISTISGTDEGYLNNLIFASFNVNGGHNLENINGEIRYDSNSLILYKVTEADTLPNWSFDFDSSKAGRIRFSGHCNNTDSDSSAINDDTALFSMTFIVHIAAVKKVEIKAENIFTEYISILKNENNCLNIDEINEALENGQTPPDPVYGELKKHTRIYFVNNSNTVTLSEKLSSDYYLKSAQFAQADLYPQFSKLTSSYTVTIDAKTPLKYDFLPEDMQSTVSVSDEKNNQIVVTVTAEDGSTNSYVFTIVRKNDYNNNDHPHDNPVDPTDPNNPVSPIENRDKDLGFLLPAVGFIAIAFIGIGFYFVYQGSHRIIYSDEN